MVISRFSERGRKTRRFCCTRNIKQFRRTKKGAVAIETVPFTYAGTAGHPVMSQCFFMYCKATTDFSWTAPFRMQRAADLLKNTELTVSKIADYLGYYDTSSFRHAFKNYYGTTPKSFR